MFMSWNNWAYCQRNYTIAIYEHWNPHQITNIPAGASTITSANTSLVIVGQICTKGRWYWACYIMWYFVTDKRSHKTWNTSANPIMCTELLFVRKSDLL